MKKHTPWKFYLCFKDTFKRGIICSIKLLTQQINVIPAYEIWVSVGLNYLNHDVDRNKNINS